MAEPPHPHLIRIGVNRNAVITAAAERACERDGIIAMVQIDVVGNVHPAASHLQRASGIIDAGGLAGIGRGAVCRNLAACQDELAGRVRRGIDAAAVLRRVAGNRAARKDDFASIDIHAAAVPQSGIIRYRAVLYA